MSHSQLAQNVIIFGVLKNNQVCSTLIILVISDISGNLEKKAARWHPSDMTGDLCTFHGRTCHYDALGFQY